jgi:DNA-binding transcriptional regulator GbsR (MarR family)
MTRQAFVEAGGNFCRKVGLPKSLGQIYGLLFLSSKPLSLDHITDLLEISKASASVGTRQLMAWGMIRQVWVPGSRRDHFEAVPELRQIARRAYEEFLRPKIDASEQRYRRLRTFLDEDLAAGRLTPEEHEFCAARLQRVGSMQEQVRSALPLLKQVL